MKKASGKSGVTAGRVISSIIVLFLLGVICYELYQIAIELNLSEGAISRRIKKMRKNGVEIPNKKNKIDDKEIFTESKSSTSQVARNTLIEYILRIKETKNATNDQIRKLAGYYGVEDIINSILSQEGRWFLV